MLGIEQKDFSMSLTIKFQSKRKEFVLPEYKTSEAACFDVVAHHIEFPKPNFAIVYLGFACEIPFGYHAVMQLRSSGSEKGWAMLNAPGRLDSDYRGEYILKLTAIPNGTIYGDKHPSWLMRFLGIRKVELSYPPFPFEIGERVAQISIEQAIQADLVLTDELTSTIRSEGGFASTGRF